MPAIRLRFNELWERILEGFGEERAHSQQTRIDLPHRLYFCRYRRCPRASQGFLSMELRQLHESSHLPLYRCENSKCYFFGYNFTSRATISQHIVQYHHEQDILTIASPLLSRRRRRVEDKALFRLKETLAESKARANEEDASIDDDWLEYPPEYCPSTLKQATEGWSAYWNPGLRDRHLNLELVGSVRNSSVCLYVDISPCNKLVAAGFINQAVVFDINSGTIITTIEPGTESFLFVDKVQIRGICFSPCSNYLAVCSSAKTLEVKKALSKPTPVTKFCSQM